jgi:hypothetical protein
MAEGEPERAPWVMPPWMEPYRDLIGNTGGNPIEELYNDRTTAQQNLIRAALALAVQDQVNLLYRLHRKGWLIDLADPALCGYCRHHADLHTYNSGHRATAVGVVPCVQCSAGVCPRPMPPVRRSPARCEARAHKGTGQGICDRLLDEHGQCDRASSHV